MPKFGHIFTLCQPNAGITVAYNTSSNLLLVEGFTKQDRSVDLFDVTMVLTQPSAFSINECLDFSPVSKGGFSTINPCRSTSN